MTRLYKLANEVLVPVPQGQLASEDMIEGWVAEQPSLLGLDILVIGRQVIDRMQGGSLSTGPRSLRCTLWLAGRLGADPASPRVSSGGDVPRPPVFGRSAWSASRAAVT